MTFQNVLYLVDVMQPCMGTTTIIESLTLHDPVQTVNNCNKLGFNLLVYLFVACREYKKLDTVVITHNFSVTPSIRLLKQ